MSVNNSWAENQYPTCETARRSPRLAVETVEQIGRELGKINYDLVAIDQQMRDLLKKITLHFDRIEMIRHPLLPSPKPLPIPPRALLPVAVPSERQHLEGPAGTRTFEESS